MILTWSKNCAVANMTVIAAGKWQLYQQKVTN